MLPIPFAALPRDCPGKRSKNRHCGRSGARNARNARKRNRFCESAAHKGAVKQENIGQFRPHSPRRRVGRPGRRHPACGQLPCARTNTAELGAAPLERADVPAGARKRWEAYLQRYASHRCECRCPKMPLHGDAFPRPPLSMAGSTKSSVSVRGGIWKRTLHCETPGRFFRHYGPNVPSGLPFGTKQKNICMQRNRTSALAMLGS